MTEFYLTMSNAFASISENINKEQILYELSKQEKERLLNASSLAHKGTQALATSYALHAIENLLSHLDKKLDHQKSGIFTSSGFYNVPLSLGYLHDIKHSGQSLASPLQFPYIIANAMPTSLARHFGFKSFAIALGHDHLAYLDCLYRGIQSLKAPRCERCFCCIALGC